MRIDDLGQRQGIVALDAVTTLNLLCLPGVTDPAVLEPVASYSVERNAFLIADPPQTHASSADLLSALSPRLVSENAAIYYPWIRVTDPLQDGGRRSCAPSGTVAGLFARIDRSRGVWKAPAGIEATLVGVEGVERQLDDAEAAMLGRLGVNPIRVFPGVGVVVWGARTSRGADEAAGEFAYVPVRRLALFIEQSLDQGTRWVVFEPNDEPLWAEIRTIVRAFMQDLLRQGALVGATSTQAYFVKCGRDTMTQNDIDNGIVNILVGFAPLRPAEFVILKIRHLAASLTPE